MSNEWSELEGEWHRGPQQELAAQIAARRDYSAHLALGRALGYWGQRWADHWHWGRRVRAARGI